MSVTVPHEVPEETAGRFPRPPLQPLVWALFGIAALLGLVVVFLAALNPIAVTDFWWQARTGEIIVRTGEIPKRDVLSWTAEGQPWVVHEWLTEVFFYYALMYLPEWVLVAYKAGLAALACALVLARSWVRSGSIAVAIVAAVWAGYLVRHYADLRPQMVSFVLLAGLLLALELYRTSRSPLLERALPWVLPPLFALWANLHGGVVVGLILAVVWVVGDAVGAWLFDEESPELVPLAVGVGASLFAVLLNPNGYHVYTYPFEVLKHPEVMDFITEWYSPNFHNPAMQAFRYLLMACIGFGLLSRGRDRVRVTETLLLLAVTHAAFTAQRNTATFGIVAAPIAAGALVSAWKAPDLLAPLREISREPFVRALGAATLALALGLYLIPREYPKEWIAAEQRWVKVPPDRWYEYGANLKYFPYDAVAQMRAGVNWPERAYIDYTWGGFISWMLWPQRKVFIDGRAEVYYPGKVFDDEIKLFRAQPGWDAALERRGVQMVLTNKNGYLAAALATHPGWRKVFEGSAEVVYLPVELVENGAPPTVPGGTVPP
ncbi:MAG: hypothetical protein ACK47B_29140 [Armatimonadota bacterium]